MNSKQTNEHRVERTAAGHFAVIDPQGDTLAVVCDEALALQCAASLDSEPVRSVTVPRWDGRQAA